MKNALRDTLDVHLNMFSQKKLRNFFFFFFWNIRNLFPHFDFENLFEKVRPQETPLQIFAIFTS